MQNIMKKTAAGAVMGGALLFTGGMGSAQAAPLQIQDGLVNLALGDVTVLERRQRRRRGAALPQPLPDVDVGRRRPRRRSRRDWWRQKPLCTIADVGPITVTQNGPGNSENAPGAAIVPEVTRSSAHRPYPRGTGGEPSLGLIRVPISRRHEC